MSLSKVQALWCTLNIKVQDRQMSAFFFTGEVIECISRFLGIYFDRMLFTRKTVMIMMMIIIIVMTIVINADSDNNNINNNSSNIRKPQVQKKNCPCHKP